MDVSYRQRMHPLIAAASVSVILVSMLGAAALTGVLPTSRIALLQGKSLKQASNAPLATPFPATSPTTAATTAQAASDAALSAPAVVAAAPAAAPPVAPPAAARDEGLATAVVPRESPVAPPIPVTDGVQPAAASPVPVVSTEAAPVKPVVPAETIAATGGGAGEGPSTARGTTASAKTRYRTRTRHVAVLTPAEPVESPRFVPAYREPLDLGPETRSPGLGEPRTIASIDATGSTNREVSPVDVAPPQKAPAPVATYPVVTPSYPVRPVSSRPGAAAASPTGLDAAGRPRREAMRAAPNEDPAKTAYPRSSASGEGGMAARLGSAAGQSLGDTIDRTVSVIVGVLGGGRDEPRPTQPPPRDPGADATYR